jgi:hypothetical protein
VRPAGSSAFGPVQQLSAPGAHAGFPQVVAGRRGRALVAWWSSSDGGAERAHVAYSMRRPDGTFGAERRLGRRRGVTGFRLAGDASGRAVVVWNSLGRRAVQAATGTVTTGFGAPHRLGDGPGREGEVALGRGGHGLVAWTEGRRERSVRVASVTRRRIGSPHTLAHGAAHSLDVLIDQRGRRIVSWRELGHGTRSLHAALAPRGRHFSEAVLDPGRTLFYSIAATSRGDALVTWLASEHDGWHVHAASAEPGKRFGRGVQLDRRSDSPSIPHLAVGPAGKALAYWPETPKRGNGATVVVRYFRP